MNTSYKIILTCATNQLDCDCELVHMDTSLTPANEAIFAQVMTDTLNRLYADQGREMLCVREIDVLGNESAFYQ